MSAARERSNRRSLITSVGAWSATHRRRAVVAWVAVLVAALGISGAAGSAYSNSNSLPGTQAQRAYDLLARHFPGQSGDTDQIVFHVSSGTVIAPAVESRIAPMLAAVARLPHVAGVTSPYSPAGRAQIARDGQTAFATVTFDKRANAVPVDAVKRVISTAQTARSSTLQVELGGQAIQQAQGISIGFATAVGIVAAILILLLTFGTLVAAGLPIITALLGLGTAFGVIALVSHVVQMPNISTELAAMMGLGVGIDYALFIVTRFREAVGRGSEIPAAIAEAMDTAGRAVVLAATTVIVALLGMLAVGVGFLTGLAVSSAIAVLLTMLATLTLLPALLGRFGARIARGRSRRSSAAAATPTAPSAPRGCAWWGEVIRRRPWPAAIAGGLIMLAVAAPALTLRLGLSDAGNDAPGTTTHKAYVLLADSFGKGFNGPLVVVAQLPGSGDTSALAAVRAAVATTPDVGAVTPPRISPDGSTAVIDAFPRSAPQATATTRLVGALRGRVLPPIARATGTTLLVGGPTAGGIDFTHVLAGKLPLFIALVVVLGAALLLVMFRSVVIPLQAAAMNLLSVGAALGATVLVFQDGWLGGLLGISAGPIEPWLPVLLFAIVFGLSMDYEVFLISRIRERWLAHGDASEAVIEGIASTGRVITAAATIMICVFLSFVFGDDRAIKLFGLSLATAVFLDAFVIRSLLLPAVLELLGRRTWAMPRWLGKRVGRDPKGVVGTAGEDRARISVEGRGAPVAALDEA